MAAEGIKKQFRRRVFFLPPFFVFCAMMILFAANDLYPFGDQSIAWCDMNQQVIPLLLDFKDVLSGKEGFFFSFKNAGGMNFYGVFFFFLSSPFSFLVVFADKSDMTAFMNLLVMLKMCAASLTASVYFLKKHPDKPLINVCFSMLYAYSGYTMLYYQNIIWLDMACLFPLLLLSLERLQTGKRALFIWILAACMFVNYYIGYMIVLFLLLYAFVYSLLTKDRAFAGNFVMGCFIAALLSAVVWLPSLLQYFSTGRKTSVIDGLMRSAFFTSYETAYPTLFSVLFLLPFALYKKGTKDGKLRLILFLLTIVPIIVEPINKMWQTGSYMSFPTRYGFMTIFLGLTLAMDGIAALSATGTIDEKSKRISRAVNILSVGLGVIYVLYAVLYTKTNVEIMDAYATSLWGNGESFAALLKLYAAAFAVGLCLFAAYRFRLLKPLCLFLCIGLLTLSELYVSPSVYMLPPARSDANYRTIVDLADKIEEDGFYRVKTEREYSYHSFDVNLMGGIGYNALGHYTSLTSENYMTAIKRFGYTSYWMEVGNSGGTALSDALMSVGYTVSESAKTGVYKNQRYTISKNPYYLPMGVVAKRDIIAAAPLDNAPRGVLQSVLYEDFFGEHDAVSVYTIEDANPTDLKIEEREDGTYRLTPESANASVTFALTAADAELFYFSVFGENTNALTQAINGGFTVSAPSFYASDFPSKKQNGMVKIGEYARREFNVTVRVHKAVTVSDFSIVGIRKAKLERGIEEADAVGLTETKNALHGEYEAAGGECVFLSVAYDKGLTLKINGKKRELHEVYGGFCAFYLEEGKNEIEISFSPQGFALGAVLSAVGLAVFSAAALFAAKGKKLECKGRANAVLYYGILAAGIAVLALVYGLPVILCLFG